MSKHCDRFRSVLAKFGAPDLSQEKFNEALKLVVLMNDVSVPAISDGDMYVRILLVPMQPMLGLRLCSQHKIIFLASPVGAYHRPSSTFLASVTPFDRVGAHGLGRFKACSNYAVDLALCATPEDDVHTRLFLEPGDPERDVQSGEALTWDAMCSEFTVANIIGVSNDRKTLRAPMSPTMLPSITRIRLIERALAIGLHVDEAPMALRELRELSEIGMCGTAVVLQRVDCVRLRIGGELHEVRFSEKSRPCSVLDRLRQELEATRRGELSDVHGWYTVIPLPQTYVLVIGGGNIGQYVCSKMRPRAGERVILQLRQESTVDPSVSALYPPHVTIVSGARAAAETIANATSSEKEHPMHVVVIAATKVYDVEQAIREANDALRMYAPCVRVRATMAIHNGLLTSELVDATAFERRPSQGVVRAVSMLSVDAPVQPGGSLVVKNEHAPCIVPDDFDGRYLAAVLSSRNMPVRASASYWKERLAKMLCNICANGLSVIHDECCSELAERRVDALREIHSEAVATIVRFFGVELAKEEGAEEPAFEFDQVVLPMLKSYGDHYPSTHADAKRGRRVEIQYATLRTVFSDLPFM